MKKILFSLWDKYYQKFNKTQFQSRRHEYKKHLEKNADDKKNI